MGRVTAAKPDVTRWGAAVELALVEAGLNPAEWLPAILSLIHGESSGKPSARNKRENAIGLGQTWGYVDGKHYKPTSPPYVVRGMAQAKNPISWDPSIQIKTIVGLLAHQNKHNARGHVPSAFLGYMSGGGNLKKLVLGESPNASVVNHLHNRLPELFGQGWNVYGTWYAGWIKAGRQTRRASVQSGEGTTYTVTLSDGQWAASPPPSPWDGTVHYRGTITAAPTKPGAFAAAKTVAVQSGGAVVAAWPMVSWLASNVVALAGGILTVAAVVSLFQQMRRT